MENNPTSVIGEYISFAGPWDVEKNEKARAAFSKMDTRRLETLRDDLKTGRLSPPQRVTLFDLVHVELRKRRITDQSRESNSIEASSLDNPKRFALLHLVEQELAKRVDIILRRESSRSRRDKKPLSKQEFDFAQLDKIELQVCRNYELAREIALNERAFRKDATYPEHCPLLEEKVLKIRKNWKVRNLKTKYAGQTPLWLQIPATSMLVLYPEWPGCPYLKIPKTKRLDRLHKLFPELKETDDLDHKVTRIERELRGLRDSEKSEHVEPRANLLAELARICALVQPDGRGAKIIHNMRIAIPVNSEWGPSVYRKDVETALRAWLLWNFPDLPDQKERGRTNKAVRDDLNSLAVARLVRAGKKRSEIVKLVRLPGSDGSKSYSSGKKLDYPLRRLHGRLTKFYLSLLEDLEPLEPLDITHAPINWKPLLGGDKNL